jgi:hypothetical protein
MLTPNDVAMERLATRLIARQAAMQDKNGAAVPGFFMPD